MESTAFFQCGNSLALDLVNTEVVANHLPVDLLPSWEAAASWAVATGVITADDLPRFLASAPTPLEQGRALQRLHSLRATLRTLCDTIAAEHSAPLSDSGPIADLNAVLRVLPGGAELSRGDAGWRLLPVPIAPGIEPLLGAIARSMADLLVTGDLDRLRRCASPSCVLWFYDTSRSGARRWCSMQGCGNRAKVAAFNRRRSG